MELDQDNTYNAALTDNYVFRLEEIQHPVYLSIARVRVQCSCNPTRFEFVGEWVDVT